MLFIEKYYPLFVSVVVAIVGDLIFIRHPEILLSRELFINTLTVSMSSLLLSFLVMTLFTLMAIGNATVVTELKQLGIYKRVGQYIMSAIDSSFISVG